MNYNKWTQNLWRLQSAPDLFIEKRDESKKQESKQEQEERLIYIFKLVKILDAYISILLFL